ncbi:MAG: hypothetical protein FRX49_00749 [Trebouxia sp. A1-2]|nr:MAG: hypothetical protein FRX49_00749 [Trebouxia sp. A1-2]
MYKRKNRYANKAEEDEEEKDAKEADLRARGSEAVFQGMWVWRRPCLCASTSSMMTRPRQVKTEWERLDSLFMLVSPMRLFSVVVHHTCFSLHLARRPDPSDDLQAGLAIEVN